MKRKNPNGHSAGCLQMPRYRGVALIEALIALAVIVAGSAAVFGVQAYVMGSSAESRLGTAAMSLAQEKLEELRNLDYTDLVLGADDDDHGVLTPGIAGVSTVALTRCWLLSQERDGLLQADVAVVRGSENCNPMGPGLAHLSTLIARHDPRAAGRQFAGVRLSDGEGEVLSDYTPEGAEGDQVERPSGFIEDRDEDGTLLAVYTPLVGGVAPLALIPPASQSSLKYAEISGNIIFKGDRRGVEGLATSYAGLVDIGTEGAAICRLYFNVAGTTTGFQAGADIEGESFAGYTYLQYSCVVANQWRRSIFLRLPAGTSDKVCVGNPDLPDLGEETDTLAIGGRVYWGQTLAGGLVVDSGMRGTSDGLSQIGSVAGNDGWVPGGHHFFVTDGGGESCVESMETTLDAEMLLFRNPQRLYCTSTKDLAVTLEESEDGTLIEASGCVPFTRVSGFVPAGISTSTLDGQISYYPYTAGSFQSVGCNPSDDPLTCDTYKMDCGIVVPDSKAYLCDFRGNEAKVKIIMNGGDRVIPPLAREADLPVAVTPDNDPIETLGDIPHDAVLEDF